MPTLVQASITRAQSPALRWLAALTIALAASPDSVQAQGQGIAGGQRIAVRTTRLGWLTGSFHDIRGDTLVLARENSSARLEIPYDSIVGWRVPTEGRVGRAVRASLLGGLAGAMAGAGVGFEGATKVTAASDVRRAGLRFGIGGFVVGAVVGARPRWRDVNVALARGAPGEELLVMTGVGASVDDEQPFASTVTSSVERALITRSELERIEGATALDAIRRLRPHFLHARRAEVGRQALVMPVVYLDGQRLGELRSLESIQLRSVLEIQYYSPTEASMRWGLGLEGGVIHVALRRA